MHTNDIPDSSVNIEILIHHHIHITRNCQVSKKNAFELLNFAAHQIRNNTCRPHRESSDTRTKVAFLIK